MVAKGSENFRTLQCSRLAYKGHLTRIYQEIEPLLLDSVKFKTAKLKLLVLEAALDKFEQAHITCVESTNAKNEVQELSPGFESEFHKIFEFRKQVNEWVKCAQLEGAEIQPMDSVSQHSAPATSKGHRSDLSSSSHLSVKIKIAKAKETTAQLKLHQLQRKLELSKRCASGLVVNTQRNAMYVTQYAQLIYAMYANDNL